MAEATNQDTEGGNDESDTAISTPVATDEPSLTSMLVKDAALLLAALSLWAAADTWYTVSGLWLAQFIAVADAILVGLLLTTLLHEWGHYLGAVSSQASVRRINPSTRNLFRFKFDYAANDHRQFHWMTYGGHIAHWAITLMVFIALPMNTLGRISLVGAMIGFIAFASFFEYHILKDTWQGEDPGTRLAAVTAKDFQQAGVVGLLAGLFFIAGLA